MRTDPDSHVHRARLYNLAAMAFDRPGESFEAALRSGDFAAQLVESAAALDEDQLLDRAEAVADASPETDAGIDDLASTYRTLFSFTSEDDDVSPYELAYAPGDLTTNTDRLADLAGFYGAFGLEMEDSDRERVDYLSIELEFLSYTALQTAYLVLDDDETGIEVVTDAQRNFLEDHLGRWLPRFRDAMQEHVDEPFYRELAAMLAALVERDVDRFGADPDVFDEVPPAPLESLTSDDLDVDFRAEGCGATPGNARGPQQLPDSPPTLNGDDST